MTVVNRQGEQVLEPGDYYDMKLLEDVYKRQLITKKMRTPLLEEKYHVKETEEGKFAMELDGYCLLYTSWCSYKSVLR